jgi:CCR4-NOT transcription complex subunit 7/8
MSSMKTKIEISSESIIKEVYSENFELELKKISKIIDTYNYVALDTEFPGFPKIGKGSTQREIYYNSIKANVDTLKLIQVGITLCDVNGNYPKDNASWQFNFQFDLKYKLS